MAKVIVNVTLKEGVLDPQGKAVHHALGTLGFGGIKDVRIGKQIVLQMEQSGDVALDMAHKMAKKLLVNDVIEEYTVEIG
jgi:phosphoribosylformylglycinamidine synthase